MYYNITITIYLCTRVCKRTYMRSICAKLCKLYRVTYFYHFSFQRCVILYDERCGWVSCLGALAHASCHCLCKCVCIFFFGCIIWHYMEDVIKKSFQQHIHVFRCAKLHFYTIVFTSSSQRYFNSCILMTYEHIQIRLLFFFLYKDELITILYFINNYI